MGQKVNPNVMRLGITKLWTSNWFANKKNFSKYLEYDYKIRQLIFKHLSQAFVSQIVIERFKNNIRIKIYSSRPGIIFSRPHEEFLNLRCNIEKIISKNISIQLTVTELNKTEIYAKLIADNISYQLKQRIMYRRILKRTVQHAMKIGVQGMKVELSGRLSGVDIARTEWYREGRVPLHTFRAKIDYCLHQSLTNYGVIGIKVWIFKGEMEDKLNFFPQEKTKDIFFNIKKDIENDILEKRI